MIMRVDPPSPSSVVITGRDLFDPSWSPDGTRLAYSKMNAVGYRTFVIYTVRTDGTDVRQLTSPLPGQDMSDLASVWSPDGRFIAFQREALCPEEPLRVCRDILVVPSDGGDVRYLTMGAPTFDAVYYKRVALEPTW